MIQSYVIFNFFIQPIKETIQLCIFSFFFYFYKKVNDNSTSLTQKKKKKKVPKSTQKSFFFERYFCSLLRFLFFLQLFHLGWIALPFASANFLLYFSVSYALNVNCQVSLGWLENSRDKLIKCAFTCFSKKKMSFHIVSSMWARTHMCHTPNRWDSRTKLTWEEDAMLLSR